MKFDFIDILSIVGVLLLIIGIYGQTNSVWITMIAAGATLLLISFFFAYVKALAGRR